MKTRIEPTLQNDNTSADAIYGKDEVSCNLRGKGNDINRPTPVLQGDLSSFDVICGKDKVSYNHTGKGSDKKYRVKISTIALTTFLWLNS